MPKLFKTFILVACCLISLWAAAQAGTTDNPQLLHDDEFNLFLFALLALSLCGFFGAALVCVLALALLLGVLFLLSFFGMLSAATIVGLYKRSFTAGFRSFLMLSFAVGGGLSGCIIFFAIGAFFQLPIARTTASLTGLASGAAGGVLLAKASFKTIRFFLHYLQQKSKAMLS